MGSLQPRHHVPAIPHLPREQKRDATKNPNPKYATSIWSTPASFPVLDASPKAKWTNHAPTPPLTITLRFWSMPKPHIALSTSPFSILASGTKMMTSSKTHISLCRSGVRHSLDMASTTRGRKGPLGATCPPCAAALRPGPTGDPVQRKSPRHHTHPYLNHTMNPRRSNPFLGHQLLYFGRHVVCGSLRGRAPVLRFSCSRSKEVACEVIRAPCDAQFPVTRHRPISSKAGLKALHDAVTNIR